MYIYEEYLIYIPETNPIKKPTENRPIFPIRKAPLHSAVLRGTVVGIAGGHYVDAAAIGVNMAAASANGGRVNAVAITCGSQRCTRSYNRVSMIWPRCP